MELPQIAYRVYRETNLGSVRLGAGWEHFVCVSLLLFPVLVFAFAGEYTCLPHRVVGSFAPAAMLQRIGNPSLLRSPEVELRQKQLMIDTNAVFLFFTQR